MELAYIIWKVLQHNLQFSRRFFLIKLSDQNQELHMVGMLFDVS